LLGDFSKRQKQLVASLREKFTPEVLDRFGTPKIVAAELTLEVAEKYGIEPKRKVSEVSEEVS
ncbi:MAG: hypothetical protein FJ044_01685, partial [Candidatus Cloacimonetes bacterium]|nr:hypothetical protein [Candidatus Cloacimonadota bacterium]